MSGHREINSRLRHEPPEKVAEWALARAERPIVTTSFGPLSAAMLHLVLRVEPGVPVVWIDTGWNTADTYRHAELLTRLFDLDLRIYAPDVTRARLETILGEAPSLESVHDHAAFARDVKVRPFERALADLRPDLWLSGIRREETDWRRGKDLVTCGPGGLLKVAPFFEMSEAEVKSYMLRHRIPFGDPAYHDPTKVLPRRECGIHQLEHGATA